MFKRKNFLLKSTVFIIFINLNKVIVISGTNIIIGIMTIGSASFATLFAVGKSESANSN